MRFTPKPESEVNKFAILPAGNYECEVVAAENKTSKAGNEMIVITLKAWDSKGTEYMVRDYLMEKMAHKLRHFAAGTGQLDRYESGELDASDCVGKTVVARLAIERDETGQFSDKNIVKDYIVQAEATPAPRREAATPPKTPAPATAPALLSGDDIPF